MTVATTQNGHFIRISGTIAEVLAELVQQRITKATQICYYTDDGTDAVALAGRFV